MSNINSPPVESTNSGELATSGDYLSTHLDALVIDDTPTRTKQEILRDIEAANQDYIVVRKELTSLYHWYDQQKERWDEEEVTHPELVIRKSDKFLARCLRLEQQQQCLISHLMWLEHESSRSSRS
ncbi:hypothetical protein BGW38_009946, partial [Lunasporangiospora selenospora]